MCCDSAHKTLPALTGAAYLHLSPTLPREFAANAKRALAMFGSTSPSYLILQSLDALNAHLAGDYPARMAALCEKIAAMKARLYAIGWRFAGDEPMKLTIDAKASGHTGEALADALRAHRIECEFADPDYLVMMFAPSNSHEDFRRLTTALCALTKREPLTDTMPAIGKPQVKTSLRDALFAPAEVLPLSDCVGRVLASPTVSCPPAVPVLVGGEVVDESAVAVFRYYGYETLRVVKEG
jgi:arginine/lysine/ornithine decarboxylase